VAFDVVMVAEGLQNFWGLVFLFGGCFLVMEKLSGCLRIVGADGKLSESAVVVWRIDGLVLD